jgi:magnesium transporter
MAKRKHRIFRKRRPPAGAMPGTLVVPTGAPPPHIYLMQYNADSLHEETIRDVRTLRDCLRPDAVSWVDVQGLGDEATLRALAEVFSIHLLALEDVVHIPQLPKTETYEHHQYFVTRMIRLVVPLELETEQVSIFIGRNYVVSFQERVGDVYEPIRNRIRKNAPVRRMGADFLGYAIIDATIDGYYPVVEAIGEQIETLEESILNAAAGETIGRVQDLKRKLLLVRRAVRPQRDAINALIRDDTPMVSQPVCVYLRDCHDHCVQLIDVIEIYREMCAGLTELYLSSLAHRQNEVMKVLTIMASVFIPLTFVVGIYGMNFEHMPELHWKWAYPALLVSMLLLVAGMLAYFRRMGWWGRLRAPRENHETSARTDGYVGPSP